MSRPDSLLSPADERSRSTILEQARTIAQLTQANLQLTKANAKLSATNGVQAERIEKKRKKISKLERGLQQLTTTVVQLQTALDAQRAHPDILVSPMDSRDRTPFLDLNEQTIPPLRSETPTPGVEERRPLSREHARSFRNRFQMFRQHDEQPTNTVHLAALDPSSQRRVNTPRPLVLFKQASGRDTPRPLGLTPNTGIGQLKPQ